MVRVSQTWRFCVVEKPTQEFDGESKESTQGENMKKVIIGAYLTLSSLTLWAACSTHTYYANGRYVTCQTCCYGNNCNTNCY
jgi:hypothetical protein